MKFGILRIVIYSVIFISLIFVGYFIFISQVNAKNNNNRTNKIAELSENKLNLVEARLVLFDLLELKTSDDNFYEKLINLNSRLSASQLPTNPTAVILKEKLNTYGGLFGYNPRKYLSDLLESNDYEGAINLLIDIEEQLSKLDYRNYDPETSQQLQEASFELQDLKLSLINENYADLNLEKFYQDYELLLSLLHKDYMASLTDESGVVLITNITNQIYDYEGQINVLKQQEQSSSLIQRILEPRVR